MKLSTILLALALAACAQQGFDAGSSGAGLTLDTERASSIEAPAPRRHQGNLSQGGVYDN